jgi:crotonobetainyl-CoA:carnitine CoA-transferase CaiB-like acyl-CoA transferase
VRMIGRPELLEDPRFSTLAARMQNVEAAEAIVAEWVGSLIADEVVMRLSEAELPSAKVATIKDVVENSYLREAANIIDVEHPTAGTVPMSGPVIKVGSEAPPVAPAPLLGQHTEEVLAEWLQLSAAEIADLKIARVV